MARPRDWVSAGFGLAAGAAAILAVGGAFRWAQALVAVLVALALAVQLTSRRVLGRISPLVAALLVPLGLTALSLVPLPSAIRELADPVGVALREDGADLLELSPWPGLTRDAPGAVRALVFFAILLGVAMIALRTTASERGRYRIVAAVGGLCGLTAVIVGIHEVLGATHLYGIYEVERAKPSVLGPLLNENHLGGLMAMGTCVAIGLAMHRRQRSWMRAAWVGVVLMCGIAAAASGSRGALLALIAGGMVTLAVLIGQKLSATDATGRKRGGSFVTSSLPIGVVAICVVVVVIYSSAGKVTAELDRTTVEEIHRPRSKFVAWKSTTSLIAESPWVGVGRGGFESSFTRVHPTSGTVTFSHAENEYLQAVVDWGIPGALLVACALGWFAVVALRRWRDGALAAGSLGALAAIALQSNVDFGIELLGLAVPVTAVAATLAYVPLREGQARALQGARITRGLLVLALLGGAALLLSPASSTLEEDHARLGGAKPVPLDEIRTVLERHPLDYYGYAIASQMMIRTGDPRSISLLNHAMRLHPTLPDLHRIAARLLYRSGHPDQSAIEYAATLRATPEPQRLLAEIVSLLTPPQAALAIPTDYDSPELVLQILMELKRDNIATLWLLRMAELHPRDAHICDWLYEVSLRSADLNAVEAAGKTCVGVLPDRETRMALARMLLGQHAYTETIRMLQDVEIWRGLIDEKVTAWLALCDAHIGLRHWDDATLCLHRLEASGIIQLDERGPVIKRLEQIAQDRRSEGLEPGPGSSSGSSSGPAPSRN